MAYPFNFDLSRLPKSFFREISNISRKRDIHGKIGRYARKLAKKFKLYELTGLPVADGLLVVEDLLDTYMRNISNKEKFGKTKKRALLLPHCSRKYMDGRCQAKFDKNTSSYSCANCSPDCPINKATTIGEKNGYVVYVLPGGSCIRKIIKNELYEGVIGVACCEEIKLGAEYLDSIGIPVQSVPLTKNGCSNTKFDLRALRKMF